MDNTNVVNIAKDYLNNTAYSHITDGTVTVENHNAANDLAISKLIPQSDDSKVSNENYQVVQFSKNLEIAPNVNIPKIVRVVVENGNVTRMVESK